MKNKGNIAALVAALLTFLLPLSAFAQDDTFAKALEEGPFVAAGGAFVGGLLVSLTPCVYPMIAITVSIFGAKQAKSRKQAMLLSTSFVLGIVVLFTTMMVVTALAGGVFGAALQNQWVIVGISLVFVAMAASMFGAFEMALPDSIAQRLNTVGGIGYGGAFMLGLVSGLVAAPCTGPVLTGIMVWIANTQDVVMGTVVGATFSLGLGVPFWLVGTFAVALPKGGKWMLWVKSFFGIVMLVMALYFLGTTFPVLNEFAQPGTMFMLIMAGVVALGIALGAVHLDWHDGGITTKLRKGVGIALATAAGAMFFASCEKPPIEAETPIAAVDAEGNAVQLLTWEHEEGAAVEKAKTEKRPLMVDFTADWCAACKKLTKHTFANAEVKKKAGNYVAVKIDATDDEDPKVAALMKKYGVVGLPTVVIYDSEGQEAKRFNDFVEPDKFLTALDGIN